MGRSARDGEKCGVGRSGPKTKRPSVETEGRLTIACHMKRDNDPVVCRAQSYASKWKTKELKIIK